MQLLAHRGQWQQLDQRNHPDSLRKAIQAGFGIETDIRDAVGKLVIAHDPPTEKASPFDDFLAVYNQIHAQPTLALNIKADGLRAKLKPLLEKYSINSYFCFDMSVPETLMYRREGLRYFTRESEYEPHPPLYEDAAGVWMDMFHSEWIQPENILRHLDVSKQVVLVSPELHRRPHEAFWQRLRETELWKTDNLMLCTDYPDQARKFFYA